MKATLQPGITHEHRFTVTASKTVPALYPESAEFAAMPEVFATGFMVGLLEWACIEAIRPHLDGALEQSVGTRIDVTHEAATPPRFTVTTTVRLIEVAGRRLVFDVTAHDGVDVIARGRHERFIIERPKFDARLAAKAALAPR